jgi:hypothetical protein
VDEQTPPAPATPEADTKDAAPAAAPAPGATLRQVLTAQNKLDAEFRIGNIVLNTSQGVAVSVPQCGRKDADGDFQMTSVLGEMALSPEGMKLLLDLKGKPDEPIVKTLKDFFLAQLHKKLDEPISQQQVQAQ